MALESLTALITGLFAFIFTGYESSMLNLVMYTVAMVVYGVVIWNYYRHLARRDIFKIDFSKYRSDQSRFVWIKKFFDGLFYILKYIIIFPLFTFLWFAVISFFLLFLAKTLSIENILLVSITIVSAVRVTSYYSEDLSKDLAKMIPFALLGVFVVDPTSFSVGLVWERLLSLPSFSGLIGRYLLFVILLEFGLRLLRGLAIAFMGLIGLSPKTDIETPPILKKSKE